MIEDFKESEDKERQEKEPPIKAVEIKEPELSPTVEGPLKAIIDLFKGASKLIPPKMIPSMEDFEDELIESAPMTQLPTVKNIHVQIGQCLYSPHDPFKTFRSLKCTKIPVSTAEPSSPFIRSASTPLPTPPHPPAFLQSHENIFKSINHRLKYLEHNSTLSYSFLEEQTEKLNEALLKVEQVAIQASFRTRDELGTELAEKFDSLKSDMQVQWKIFEKEWSYKLSAYEQKIDAKMKSQFNEQVYRVGGLFLLAQILVLLGLILLWRYGSTALHWLKKFWLAILGEFVTLKGGSHSYIGVLPSSTSNSPDSMTPSESVIGSPVATMLTSPTVKNDSTYVYNHNNNNRS